MTNGHLGLLAEFTENIYDIERLAQKELGLI